MSKTPDYKLVTLVTYLLGKTKGCDLKVAAHMYCVNPNSWDTFFLSTREDPWLVLSEKEHPLVAHFKTFITSLKKCHTGWLYQHWDTLEFV